MLISTICWQSTTLADESLSATNPTGMVAKSTGLDRRFGAGILLGEPTGASLKYFFNETLAVDGAFGWSFDDDTDFDAHVDALFHRQHLVTTSAGQLAGYLGVGGRVQVRDNRPDCYGIRFPVGVSFMFDEVPIDVFGEVAPILDVEPSVDGDFNAGVGVRYWF